MRKIIITATFSIFMHVWYSKTPTGKKRSKFMGGDDEDDSGKKEKKKGKKKK